MGRQSSAHLTVIRDPAKRLRMVSWVMLCVVVTLVLGLTHVSLWAAPVAGIVLAVVITAVEVRIAYRDARRRRQSRA